MHTPRNVTAFAIIVTLTTLSGCGLHGKPVVAPSTHAGGPSVAAAAAPLLASGEPGRVVAPGIVEPWGDQIEVAAQESGWIAEILVKEGEVVAAGQPLAMLEHGAQKDGVDVAEGELLEAAAALAKLERGATAEELQQAQADVDAALARTAFAQALDDRTASLHSKGWVADSEADRTGADARSLAAQADRAAARLRELRRGARIEDLDAARARVTTARAKLALARGSLARRRIEAPSAGTILLARFHRGEYYAADSGPLFVLGDMTRLQVRMEVDEVDATSVAPGAPCSVYSDAGARLSEGTIVRLAPKMGRRALPLESPTARADVRVREVFVAIPASASLVPGQRVWGHAVRRPS